MSQAEFSELKLLSDNQDWQKSVDFATARATRDFRVVFSGIFEKPSDLEDMKAVILSPDDGINEEDSEFDPATSSKLRKRYTFLRRFMPILRRRLARRGVFEIIASGAGIGSAVVETLLSEFIRLDGKLDCLDALQSTIGQAVRSDASFDGYIVPPSDAEYRFVCELESGSPHPSLLIDGQQLSFQTLSEDEIWTESLRLKGGRAYPITLNGIPIEGELGLRWKSSQGAIAAISPEVLFPRFLLNDPNSQTPTQKVILQVKRAAVLIRAFELNSDEIRFLVLSSNKRSENEVEQIDLENIDFADFVRVYDYAQLRDRMKDRETTLLRLFIESDTKKVEELVCSMFKIDAACFFQLLNALRIERETGFRTETNLLKMREILDIAKRTGASVEQLFRWTH